MFRPVWLLLIYQIFSPDEQWLCHLPGALPRAKICQAFSLKKNSSNPKAYFIIPQRLFFLLLSQGEAGRGFLSLSHISIF